MTLSALGIHWYDSDAKKTADSGGGLKTFACGKNYFS